MPGEIGDQINEFSGQKAKNFDTHVSKINILEKDDSDCFAIILGEMLVIDLEPIFYVENKHSVSLHEQILLLLWIHTVSLRV